MSSPCEPRPCALHVLVPGGGGERPDLVGLLTALGDHFAELTVHTTPDADGEVRFATLARAADVIDDLRGRTPQDVRYEEQGHDIAEALRGDVARGLRPVVVIPSDSPRRAVRAARRAAARTDAHVAVVPTAATSPADDREVAR